MIDKYKLTPWKLSVKKAEGGRTKMLLEFFETKTAVLDYLNEIFKNTYKRGAKLYKYENGEWVEKELPTTKDLLWFVVTIDTVVEEFLLIEDAKSYVTTLAGDIKKEPVFKRAANQVYEYFPGKNSTLGDQYFIGTREALIKEGWEEQFETWEELRSIA